MSYDLHFTSQDNKKITKEDFLNYFKDKPNYQIPEKTEKDFQIWYENPNTGVYFNYSFNEDEGIDFNINYLRPTFFAYETMPLVVEFAEHFDLLVVDPQDHEIGGDGAPKECVQKELIETWARSNAVAVQNSDTKKHPYLPHEKTYPWWIYISKR